MVPFLSFACLMNSSYLGVFCLISYGNQSKIRHISSSYFFSSYGLNICFVFIEETGPHSARTGPSRSVLHPCPFGGGERKRMERSLWCWVICAGLRVALWQLNHWTGSPNSLSRALWHIHISVLLWSWAFWLSKVWGKIFFFFNNVSLVLPILERAGRNC